MIEVPPERSNALPEILIVSLSRIHITSHEGLIASLVKLHITSPKGLRFFRIFKLSAKILGVSSGGDQQYNFS